ncbi:MAG: glycosyltransferase family 2 protein, partial [Chthoniobacterales bacterium]|nr:glycosyltransferase family 2 protein [Chthoniobacterales bacterium]
CVIVPTYNSGPLLEETLRALLKVWQPVIVVVDGSDDGSRQRVRAMAGENNGLEVLTHERNRGKGAAVLTGMECAAAQGMTHAAVFDADGQHVAGEMPRFMRASIDHPAAMILGVPQFGEDAPSLRVDGRRVGNWWANLETWWGGIDDSLFGFRVYPVEPSRLILRSIIGGKRFDFDTQLAVRLYWAGVPPLNLRTPVRYPRSEKGGVSHFRYVRDNLLLTFVHAGLFLRSLTILPSLYRYRRRGPLTPSDKS